MISLPQIGQVYMMFRARLLDLDFGPGPESLEVRLFREDEIPWEDDRVPHDRAHAAQLLRRPAQLGAFPLRVSRARAEGRRCRRTCWQPAERTARRQPWRRARPHGRRSRRRPRRRPARQLAASVGAADRVVGREARAASARSSATLRVGPPRPPAVTADRARAAAPSRRRCPATRASTRHSAVAVDAVALFPARLLRPSASRRA